MNNVYYARNVDPSGAVSWTAWSKGTDPALHLKSVSSCRAMHPSVRLRQAASIEALQAILQIHSNKSAKPCKYVPSGPEYDGEADWRSIDFYEVEGLVATVNFISEIDRQFGSGAIFTPAAVFEVLDNLHLDSDSVPVFMCSVGCGMGSTLSTFEKWTRNPHLQTWSFFGVDSGADNGGGMTSEDKQRYVPATNFHEGDAVSYMNNIIGQNSDATDAQVWLLEMSWPETHFTSGWGKRCIEAFVIKAKENKSTPFLLYTGLHYDSESTELQSYIEHLINSYKGTRIQTVPVKWMLRNPHAPESWDKTFLINLDSLYILPIYAC